MKKKLIGLLVLFSHISLIANGEVGCNAIINNEPVGCEEENILTTTIIDIKSKIKNNTINISEKISSVEVLHDNQPIVIERIPVKDNNSCPPFCIEPMKINGVTTVAELETLEFIKDLKAKKAQLLIDVRENIVYKKSTIPGSINLPLSMLYDNSPYKEEVLKLFGAKKSSVKSTKIKWYFKHPQELLIFGQSATTNEASRAIKMLLKFGYPSSKILYYRGGVESWEALGLTLF